MNRKVLVPREFLLDPDLPPAAKLVWALLQVSQKDQRITTLHQLSGLNRRTIRRALAILAATDRSTSQAGPLQPQPPGTSDPLSLPPPRVALPAALLFDKRLGIMDKLTFGFLQLAPGLQNKSGTTEIRRLAALIPAHPATVRNALASLHRTGWVEVSQKHKFAPVRFNLANPVAQSHDDLLQRVVESLPPKPSGEALMRAYLTVLVDRDDYEENATPAFLVNPYTDQKLEFDRFYPPNVAFEYQGPQHFGPTDIYPDPSEAARQQWRDDVKLAICLRRGITLIELTHSDLTFDTMRRRINGLLPLRDLEGREAVLAFLKQESRAYHRRVKRSKISASESR